MRITHSTVKRGTRQVFLLFVILSFTCCISPKVDFYKAENFSLKNYKSIAIWNFTAPESAKQVSHEMADLVGLELMKKGYQIVERNQLEEILKEHKLEMSGAITNEMRKNILKLTGADVIMIGSIGQYNVSKQFLMMPIGMVPVAVDVLTANVSCTFKLVDINTGKLLWSASGTLSKEGTNPSVLLKEVIESCLKGLDLDAVAEKAKPRKQAKGFGVGPE